MDSRGHVAPPTAWPAHLALPPSSSRCPGGVAAPGAPLWLPGWGTFLPPPVAANGVVSLSAGVGAGVGVGVGAGPEAVMSGSAKDAAWPWLGVLAAMSAAAEESAPFLRLGGSPETDMSSLCHEVSRAGWRGRSASSGGMSSSDNNAGGGAGGGAGKGATLWRGQQKALVEAALEEGVRMVHIPGLEGNASASSGEGGGGASGGSSSGGGSSGSAGSGGSGTGAPWPGPAGYSFTCWMRFKPPSGAGGSGGGGGGGAGGGNGAVYYEGPPEDMASWSADAVKAAATASVTAAAAVAATAGSASAPLSSGGGGGNGSYSGSVGGNSGGGGIVSGAGVSVGGGNGSGGRAGGSGAVGGVGELSERDLLDASGEEGGSAVDLGRVSVDSDSPMPRRGSGGGSLGGGVAGDNDSAPGGEGSFKIERRGSADSAGGRRGTRDDDGPSLHLPGRQVYLDRRLRFFLWPSLVSRGKGFVYFSCCSSTWHEVM